MTNKLTVSYEILEQWLAVQGQWIYLEAVFNGGGLPPRRVPRPIALILLVRSHAPCMRVVHVMGGRGFFRRH